MNESKKEVAELLNNYSEEDLQELIIRMRAFANKKLGKGKSNFEGREKLDFVFSVFDKALAGIRNWDSSNCSFEEFAFGVLRSEISDYHEKQKRRSQEEKTNDSEESYILDIPVWHEEVGYDDKAYEQLDVKTQKEKFIELLKNSGADELEIFIFECWCEDIYKPREIAELAEVNVKDVYNATKRLENRKSKLIETK